MRLGDTERAEQPSPASASMTATAERYALPWRRCGSPKTTRTRRPPRSRRSWTAPLPDIPWIWLAQAFLLEAIARDALGDPMPPGAPWSARWTWPSPTARWLPFLLHPAPGLLERHARHRTAHAALIAEILGLLAGPGPEGMGGGSRPRAGRLDRPPG